MSTQIFKNPYPKEDFFSFLEKVCEKTNKYYIFNNCSYKKAILNNDLPLFIESIRPCYYLSKHKYLDAKMNYNRLTTILRQICKYHKILFTSEIKYEYSKYNIHYYFYF
jgi:hypothetical protein